MPRHYALSENAAAHRFAGAHWQRSTQSDWSSLDGSSAPPGNQSNTTAPPDLLGCIEPLWDTGSAGLRPEPPDAVRPWLGYPSHRRPAAGLAPPLASSSGPYRGY